jgi:TolA protein
MTRERTRLTLALLFSLLIHALLFSLTFGGQGLGLTGFAFRFPWQDRRIEAPDLRVVLVPVQVKAPETAVTPDAEPLQQGRAEQPVAGGFALTPPVSPALTPRRTTAAIVAGTHSSEGVNPGSGAASGAAPAKTPLRAVRPGGTAPPPVPESAVIASARSDEPTWVVPVTPAVPTPVIPTAPSASSSETAMPPLRDTANEARAQIDEEARERAVEQVGLDRARQDARRQAEQMEAARQEAERQAAAQKEVARQEAERQAAAQKEVARQEAERQAAARQEATRQETARQEAERQAAAQQEVARQESEQKAAARQEAARQEAAQQEAARQAAAQQEAARQEAEEKREVRLRAIGRQLDEEAARRDAASAASRPLPSSSGLRRYRLFGRADANAELILYVEAWERKIQLNMTFDMVREAAKLPHTNPMVTVAIRSDGSVESVTFVLSSGVVAIDEAIRRIVRSQEHYQAFPPDLVREFDVIEIRRTWSFDMAIRLY